MTNSEIEKLYDEAKNYNETTHMDKGNPNQPHGTLPTFPVQLGS